jgi:hypothetical protein
VAAITDDQIIERLIALIGEIRGPQPVDSGAAPAPAPEQPVVEPAAPPAPLAWGAHVSPQFRTFVRQMALDFPPMQADWPMACMAFESGRTFSPKVKNPHSSATGLIQFMDATAESLGTTTAALAAMTPEKQLEYVWLYFRNQIRAHGPIARLSDCYMAILNPVAMGKDDSLVMWIDGTRQFAVNAGLDADKNHQITKAEAAARVAAMLAEGLQPENAA